MQFDLSETQALLKSSVRDFLRAECPMAEVRRIAETEHACDEALWSKIAAQGWAGLLFADAAGVQGATRRIPGRWSKSRSKVQIPSRPYSSTTAA